jgi:hypothetical protein
MSFVTWKEGLVVLCGNVKINAAQPVRDAAFNRMPFLCHAQRLQGWLINRGRNR